MINLCWVLIIILTVLVWQKSKVKCQSDYRLRQWRKALDLESKARLFAQLYNEVNGFRLSKQGRQKADQLELVYGEIMFEPFIALLSLCRPNENTVFYDLGCGSGKATIAAALVYPVKKSCGVELLNELYQCSLEQQHMLIRLTGDLRLRSRILFIPGNLYERNYHDATIVFINATAFFGESWKQLSVFLEHLSTGCYVVSSSKMLQSPCFKVVKETFVEMSWGVVKAYIQQRK